jgi:hypothetical protein
MSAFGDFYDDFESNPMVRYIRDIMSPRMASGLRGSSNLSQQRQNLLLDMAGLPGFFRKPVITSPGDYEIAFGDGNSAVQVSINLPIAYDVWYIFNTVNVLEFGGKDRQDTLDALDAFFSAIGVTASLKRPTADTVTALSHINHETLIKKQPGLTQGEIKQSVLPTMECYIKEARFEWCGYTSGINHDSQGAPHATLGRGYVGYIAFPVGHPGVMDTVSLVTETLADLGTDGTGATIHSFSENTPEPGGDLIPPFPNAQKQAAGRHLMENAYVPEDSPAVEYFADSFGAGDNAAPIHQWLRYYVESDSTGIIPGEFVAISCKPWIPHCWWYQETSPFVYSGHWMENEFYTSGVIKEVLENNEYTVMVKNEDVRVKSTDYYEYAVGDRVGLLKSHVDSTPTVGGQSSFTWEDLELKNTTEILTDWRIIPVDFYGATP